MDRALLKVDHGLEYLLAPDLYLADARVHLAYRLRHVPYLLVYGREGAAHVRVAPICLSMSEYFSPMVSFESTSESCKMARSVMKAAK